MVCPRASYDPKPIGRFVVLEYGRAPTTDMYLRPRFCAPGLPPVQFIDISSTGPEAMSLDAPNAGGTFVVICRYVTATWLRRLREASAQLAGVAFFADDDLPAALSDSSLPADYRRKIMRLYGRHVAKLSAVASELWISTEMLAAKYAAFGAKLVTPVFVGRPDANQRPIRYFYHGSAAHAREIDWLIDVVAEIQRRNRNMVFEIIGDWSVRRLFRGIERIVVVHPMTWPDYLAYAATAPQDIGLAPLLSSAVNAARSPCKFFDIARFGAAGIYSDTSPYSGFIRDGTDGLLLPDRKELWVEAVLALADDSQHRSTLAGAALDRCHESARAVQPLPAGSAAARVVAAAGVAAE